MKSLSSALTLLSWAASIVSAGKLSPTDTITWGGDNSRSGYQTKNKMDPAVVGSSEFGQLWKTTLPGNYRGYLEQIYSQPLLYTLDDGIQYAFIATTQNNLYKINAKTGTIVAQRNLHIPFLTADLAGCVDINPTVGVIATGVIDPATDTWYFTAKTYEDQTDQVKGLYNGRYWFHAVDVNTLAEKPNFPRAIEGTIARNNVNRMFQSGVGLQRPALLHTGQYIYAGFASHCVQWNFTGWIMGWDKTTGAMVERYTTEAGPEKNTVPGGGVWMSGGGLATDNKGSMYFSTGNGYASQLSGTPVPGRQPPTSLEEAAVNMKLNDDGSVTVVDFFMPWEKVQLDGADKDLGTSPLVLLPPDVFTCPNAKRLGVVTGKSGKTYILNIDNLGGYQQGANKLDAVPQVFQNENSVYAGAGVYPGDGGYIYINVIQYPTHVFKFSCNAAGSPSFTKVADSPQKNAYVLGVGHGATTSLDGAAGTGLFWVTDVDGFNLRIYNAIPQNGALQLIKSANIAGVTKFARPVFGDARAYVGTVQGALYCFGSPVNLPLTCTSPNDFGKQLLNSTSAPKTIQCQANVNTQVTSLALKGNPNFRVTQQPTLPFTLTKGQNISFQAVFEPATPGPLSSDVVLGTTNGVSGFSTSTPVSLKGNGNSMAPLLSINPNTVSFSGVITGEQEGGVTQSIIWSNNGDGPLSVTKVDYSTTSEKGPFITPAQTADGVKVGPFTFKGVPSTIAGNDQATVDINFNPTTSGNFAAYVVVNSDGGKKIFTVVGTAGTYPKALLEFQAADGSGKWIPYTNNSPPFTFGNVFEQKTKELKMRLTNSGSSSAAALSVTVSKPPFGVAGLVGANNGVDLGEGTTLAAGESATATLYCSVPKSQVNSDSYNGSAVWTMNLGDPTFGKQFIQFTCNAVTEQVGPLAANGSAIYRYDGCWKENNPGRQLKVQLWGQNPNNDNGLCINACADKGYKFAATEYVDECWCGNTVPNKRVVETECNYQCSGDQTETCGGNGYFHDASYLSLFTNGAPNAGGNGPAVVPSTGPYNYSGCYTEGTNVRALGAQATASPDMTVQSCATYCSGYTYFGLEYANECYCGNAFGTGSVKTIEDQCTMNCAGNSSQICGAGGRLTVYGKDKSASSSSASSSSTSSGTATSTPKPTGPVAVQTAGTFTHQGCYTEGNGVRALGATTTASNAMTVQKCATFCSGYKYMGVEYASECFCANTIGAGAVLTTSGCSMACSGDGTSLCGGPDRLNFYLNTGGSSSTSKSMSQSSTSQSSTSQSLTSSSSTSSSTPTGPSIVQKAGVFGYKGCYSEGTAGRALSDKQIVQNTMSVEQCSNICSGFKYMGVEYGSECFCGNVINAGSVVQTSGCSMTCAGAATEYCGGPNRLNMYEAGAGVQSSSQTSSPSSRTSSMSSSQTSSSSTSRISSTSSTSTTSSSTSSKSTTPSGPTVVPSSSNFTYTACYVDGASRTLPKQVLNNAKMTVELCLSACQNYAYAGLEYGRECWCGDAIASSATKATPETQCNMQCPGDATQICGAGNRLTLYTRNPVANSNARLAFAAAQASTSSVSTGAPSSSQSTSSGSLSSTSSTSKSASQTSSSSASSTSSSSSSTSPTSSSSKTSSSSSSSGSASTSNTASQSSSSKSSTSSSSSSRLSTSSSSSTTSKATTSSASSSSTSSSTTSSTSKTTLIPTPSQTIAGYSYLGCANQTSPLALIGMSNTDTKSMTTEICQKYCLDNNYGIAATQNGDTCYCGNGLQSYSAVGQKSCDVPCTGNQTEICGGSESLSVWNSTSSTIPPTTVKAVGAYPLDGCYSGTNILTGATYTNATEMTVETCVGYCITKGYQVAGVQDGKTCYCDKTLASTAKKETSLASCNVFCAGNKREFCGAYGKSLVYQYDQSSVTNGVPNAINQPNKATITANTTSTA